MAHLHPLPWALARDAMVSVGPIIRAVKFFSNPALGFFSLVELTKRNQDKGRGRGLGPSESSGREATAHEAFLGLVSLGPTFLEADVLLFPAQEVTAAVEFLEFVSDGRCHWLKPQPCG